MKKHIFIVFIILTIVLIIYFSIFKEKPNIENLSEGIEVTKEDYIYKDKLLELGYNINDIKTIQKKISDMSTKKFLLFKKYDNLTKLYLPHILILVKLKDMKIIIKIILIILLIRLYYMLKLDLIMNFILI